MSEETTGQQKTETDEEKNEQQDGLAMEGVEVGIAAPSDQDLRVKEPAAPGFVPTDASDGNL